MIKVDYNGLVADIHDQDLKDGIAVLSSESPESRKQILKSVENSLNEVIKKVKRQEPLSSQLLTDTANDIGLWFANEILEGRAEQYKTPIQ
jgi:ClpP class serine protease